MRTTNQLTFTTYEVSLKISPNDPVKVIFDNIDWSFIHRLVKDRYSPHGADGYEPISLFKAQLLICLGEVISDCKLASPFAMMPDYVSSAASTSSRHPPTAPSPISVIVWEKTSSTRACIS